MSTIMHRSPDSFTLGGRDAVTDAATSKVAVRTHPSSGNASAGHTCSSAILV